jgi:hypothetical protein
MRSNNNFVNKLYDQLVDRRNRLEAKRLELRAKISDRYPDELYGVKGDIIFEEKKAKYDEEIKLLDKYIRTFSDMVEIMEGNNGDKDSER